MDSFQCITFTRTGQKAHLDPQNQKPKTEVDARNITSEIVTANDIWEFQLERWNLQDTHFDN